MDLPSDDQLGSYSKPPKSFGVNLDAFFLRTSINQILPTAWKAKYLPSGEAVAELAKRIFNESVDIDRLA